MRKLLDDLKIRCMSTRNEMNAFTPEGIQKAIELNQILGAKYVLLSSAGRVESIDGWKGVAERLTKVSEKLKSLNMRIGCHNHELEFVPIEGKRPMEVLAATMTRPRPATENNQGGIDDYDEAARHVLRSTVSRRRP